MKKASSSSLLDNLHEIKGSGIGWISRQGDKKAPFVRKKCNQDAHPQSKFSAFTSRYSGFKKNNRLKKINSQISLKVNTSTLQQEIKYLSPKHAYSSLTIKLDQSPQQQSRRINKDINSNRLAGNSDIYRPFEELQILDYSPLKQKYEAIDTTQQTRCDWFGLEKENQKLREQNQRLEQQLSIFTKSHSSMNNRIKGSRLEQCIKCENQRTVLELKEQNGKLQAILCKNRQEIEILKQIIGSINEQLSKQKQTISLLSYELNQSRKTQAQLSQIMQSLKEKMEKDNLQLKYLTIQQDMLMRKKQEYEKFKQEHSRKGFQRDSLRRMLNQYKQKVDLLRKVIAKGNNHKRNKLEDTQLSLQLSLDSVIN